MTWDEWWFQVLGSQGYIERIYSRFPDHLRVPEFRHADVETRHCIREQVLGEAMEAAYRGPVGEVTIACLRDGGTEWTIRNDAGPKTVVSTVEPWWMKCDAETHWCPPCKTANEDAALVRRRRRLAPRRALDAVPWSARMVLRRVRRD